MNDFETKSSAPSTGQPQDGLAGLQTQIHFLLIAMILLSGVFTTFVYIQARRARSDLAVSKQVGDPILQSFAQEKPTVDAFLGKLVDFSKTHADFAPVLAKYPWFFQSQTSAPPAAATAPKPAAPAVAKPAAGPAPAPKK